MPASQIIGHGERREVRRSPRGRYVPLNEMMPFDLELRRLNAAARDAAVRRRIARESFSTFIPQEEAL